MHPVYYVPAGDVIPVFFSTYDGGTGASVTLTGLAVTDIEIYKDGSTTQRASDAGYTLIDTDGIDVDGTTGIHGFTIDTGDNTDASFYTTGAWFTVVVSSVTVDGQTVNFIACQFRIMAAESSAGVPKGDVSHFGGSAGTFSSGRPEVNTTLIEGSDATNQIRDAVVDDATRIDASALNTATGTSIPAILVDTGTTLQGELDGIQADTEDIQSRLPAALVGGRIDANVGAISADSAAADNCEAFFDGNGYAGTGNTIPTVTNLTNKGDGSGFTAIPWNASWDAEVQSECTDALNAYDPPTKAELDTAVDALPTAAENAAAVLSAASSDPIHANIEEVNNVQIQGSGTSGDKWRPA